MSEKNRARFHRAIDKTLANLPDDPFLPQRIAQRAAQSGEGAKMRNYKWILILAVVAMMSLTAAVASEVFSGTVDWDGNVVKDETEIIYPQPTPVPEKMEEQADRVSLMMEFEHAHQAKEGEMVVFYDLTQRDTSYGWNTLHRSVADMQQFENLMAAAEGFAVPVSIPEGYTFESGLVYYGCKPEGEFRLVKTVNSDDGFRAEIYELDDENAVVTGYQLCFLKTTEDYDPANAETWEMISMYAFLGNGFEESELYVRDSTGVSAVTVPGMEKAVYIQGMDRDSLDMYGVLPQPVTSRSSPFEEAVTEHQITLTVWSDAAMSETLAMFGGK